MIKTEQNGGRISETLQDKTTELFGRERVLFFKKKEEWLQRQFRDQEDCHFEHELRGQSLTPQIQQVGSPCTVMRVGPPQIAEYGGHCWGHGSDAAH